MDLALSGKVALVTGSSRGLGFAIARRLHGEGSTVVLNGRDPEQLAKARDELDPRPHAFVADVTTLDSARRLIEFVDARHGRLDVLICNVGSGRSVPPGQETAQEWDRVLRVNLLAATNVIEAARPLLARQGGSVVCISSICGHEVLGAPLTYSAAKAALNSYVQGAARPLAMEGVRINAVSPGNMLFPGSTWEDRMRSDPVAVQAMLDREVAQRRLGSAEEVADFVVFVASPRASYATGAIFVVDGGQVRS